jgi:hypothetical protein
MRFLKALVASEATLLALGLLSPLLGVLTSALIPHNSHVYNIWVHTCKAHVTYYINITSMPREATTSVNPVSIYPLPGLKQQTG